MRGPHRIGILVTFGILAATTAWWVRKEAFDDEPVPAPIEASRAPALTAREATNPLSVIMISVDTLRPDHLSLYGYERPTSPNIDAAFRDSDIYEHAYSAEANTPSSIVTALSGLIPPSHRVRLFFQRIGPEVHLLSDHLNAAGYQTAAVVSNIVLTTEAIGFSTRFDYYDDLVDEREGDRTIFERRASRTTTAALSWLQRKREDDVPFFLWVHYIDPHAPYSAPADGGGRDFSHEGSQPIDVTKMFEYVRIPGVDDALEYVDRYDEEISYVDAEIGRLVQWLQEAGLWNDALSVFYSDHGETMAEHDIYFNHGHDVWEPIMRVPLMVRVPGTPGRRHAPPVSLTDVMPTILEHLGMPVPEGLDGIPLRLRDGTRPLSLEATGWGETQKRSLVLGWKKWTTHVSNSRELSESRLYDLREDPGELQPHPWTGNPMEALLARWVEEDPDPAGRPTELMKGIRLDAPKVAPGRTKEQMEALRSLGYTH